MDGLTCAIITLSQFTTPTSSPPLLTADFMHQLDRLDVLSRKILQGKMHGERRSKRKGQSIEFAEHRPYVMGDDLRRIDWNLYARLDKLFLRLFLEEEDLSVSILLDVSRSMDFGQPDDQHKLLYAKRTAAALAYIGLVNFNRVHVYTFSNTIDDWIGDLRGRQPVPRMIEFLESRHVPDKSLPGDLTNVFKRFSLLQRRKGVVIVLSDFLDKGNLADGLKYLAADRFDAFALQLMAPEEMDPRLGSLAGDLRLKDTEDGDTAEVSITPALLKRYQQTLESHLAHVRDACLRRGVTHLFTDTSVAFEDLILKYLRQRGLVG